MVKFATSPPLDGLLDLACRNGVDIRPTLLRVLTDLYVHKPAHSAVEETQYVELALGLIDAVDAATRTIVAARLSAYHTAPAAVLHKLESLGALAGDASLAPAREDLTGAFFMADAAERSLILTNLDAATERSSLHPAAAPAETMRQLESAALSHNTAEFSRLLERTLDIGRELAARIVNDDSGEPLVVAAKTLGMTDNSFQRIVMFLNPVIGQSVERVHALARLYEEITPNGAARMMSIWRGESERPRAAHAPLYWDDEQRSARSLSHPASRRIAQSRHEHSLKAKSGSR